MTSVLKWHPACELLPEMTEEAFRALVEDMHEHGQRRPMVVDEDGVGLDARHRDRACRELGVDPNVEVFHGTEEQKIALVISENVHRRHMSADQRAAIGAELATMKQGARTDLGPIGTMSAAEAAKVVGSSERSIKRAKHRMRTDPEAHAKAKAGILPRKHRRIRTDGDGKPKRPKVKDVPGVEGVDYMATEDKYGFKHRQPIEHHQTDSLVAAIREPVACLDQLADIADAAEQGDKEALERIISGAKHVSALCAHIVEVAHDVLTRRQPCGLGHGVEPPPDDQPEPEQIDLQDAAKVESGWVDASTFRS